MHLGVRQRLYLLVGLFALGCAALAATLMWLQEQRAWEARARQLQTLVDAAIGVLEVHKKLADIGVMPEADAKKRALDVDLRHAFRQWRERLLHRLGHVPGGSEPGIGRPHRESAATRRAADRQAGPDRPVFRPRADAGAREIRRGAPAYPVDPGRIDREGHQEQLCQGLQALEHVRHDRPVRRRHRDRA